MRTMYFRSSVIAWGRPKTLSISRMTRLSLGVEVVVVVDDAVVGMSGPRLDDLAVQHTGFGQTLGVGSLLAHLVCRGVVVFLSTVGGGDEVQDGIVAAKEAARW